MIAPPETISLLWCFECGREVPGKGKHQRSTGPDADTSTCPGTAIRVEYSDPVPLDETRRADSGPVSWAEMADDGPEFGEEMQPRASPQCGEIDCMEDTHDG